MTKSLVIGVDAGATSTRVAVHALDGTRVGYAKAGPGNPSARGLAGAVASVAAALERAVAGLDASAVAASLAGVAGGVDALEPALAKVWAEHGIAAGPRITGDVLIGYVAGSPSPDGSLLLSGTGAVAARITGHRLAAVADGLGWLLGDAGSGFWIGRAAAKAVVAALDRGATGGVLVELVVDHFLGADDGPVARVPGAPDVAGGDAWTPRDTADRIVRLAQADHMRLAALSALVSQAASAGDPLALGIVGQAAEHLVATVGRVHRGGPVVLAGSVLTSEGPVREAVRNLLAGQGPLAGQNSPAGQQDATEGTTEVATAGDAAGAAAWLAARDLLEQPERLHPVFTAGR
ncbi:N-acetylglucosamine kinase [Nonomuraea rhizosphaerae]|uniref:N-acetylglucosamine kinase n=1 Tax=Nonomuraea rhizosphaerae TaxID=2665663 RepID=UPI001C5EF35C|nr:BadF/BadG/BcrA/BcrD ATPase family protein [Nonomuraea rhizosphaerae]